MARRWRDGFGVGEGILRLARELLGGRPIREYG